MGKDPAEGISGQEITLEVDNQGRIVLPEAARDQLGIEPGERIPALLVGGRLYLNPKPSSNLEPATAGHGAWADSTPTDVGDGLFGNLDT